MYGLGVDEKRGDPGTRLWDLQHMQGDEVNTAKESMKGPLGQSGPGPWEGHAMLSCSL